MQRGIKSYFQVSPRGSSDPEKPKAKTNSVVSSDEDEKKPKTSGKDAKLSKKPKKAAILSDSEDEAPKKQAIKKESLSNSENDKTLKIVSPSDFFGKRTAKRVNANPVAKNLLKKEAEFHENDDFEKTLSRLDTSQLEAESCKTEPSDVKSSGKRERVVDAAAEDAAPKKPRRDDDFGGERRKNEDEKSKNSSPQKDPEESIEAAKNGNKLKLGNLKNSKKKTNVVFEPHEPKKKEKKVEAPDAFEEHIEKKKQRNVLYNSYLQRGGARNPGSKPVPDGASNCLAGLVFLITGVLDSLEREEAEELIQKYGGRMVKSLSKKTDYMVVGDEAGVAKLEKAATLGTKQISEDELLELIRTRPAGKSSNVVIPPRNTPKSRKRSRSPEKIDQSPSPKKICTPKETKTSPQEEKPSTSKIHDPVAGSSKDPATRAPENSNGDAQTSKVEGDHVALVEKYRPKTMGKIIGQHGDKSNARKLYTWLSNWHKNHNGTVKISRPSPYAKNDDGGFFKASLLSGPPGIGKTTTAQVVCAELGLDLLEFNASDTRSKRLLKEEVSGILSNNTVAGYFSGTSSHKLSKNHVLLMDEVDGMAGNEDRGGLQELIALIKSSDIPIICICNDRNHPKMRTLANYTFDLRFQKPRVEQIRGAMKSMCHKENINVTTEQIDQLIQSTNQDVRQVINQLAMLRASSNCKKEEGEDSKYKQADKDLRLGPWDVIRKVFSADEHKNMSIHDKSNLFFHDYNIAGLFVQENYLSVTPNRPKEETLMRIASSADSLAVGDLIENAIRGHGAWSLLPTQACFSSVIPGTLMAGRLNAQANFPSWLGRNAKRGKFDRLLQEITVHTRLATGASKESINIDYLKQLRDAILRPLAHHETEGIEESLKVMNSYHLLREDLESLVEVSLWPGQRDPWQVIDSKVRAAFTRAYNKSSAPAPYLINVGPKKKNNQASQDEGFMDDGDLEDEGSDQDDDHVDTDRMIKAKKATASTKAASTSTKAASTSKAPGKGTSRGRGRGKAK